MKIFVARLRMLDFSIEHSCSCG